MISGEAIVNAWKERRRSHATPPLPQHPQLPADCYSHILKFINVADRPITNRASLVSYVQKKNRRLGAIPLLVQLLMFFYMLPHIGIDLPAIGAAIAATGMCSAAYTAEILRGALQAIPRGQSEAAEALGIPPLALWRRILVPQAIRIGLPSLVNELILLVKVSSLASVVGIAELTRVAQNITGETYRPLEIYVTAAAIYFVINFTLSRIGRLAERRLQIG